jgi:hypothetical protein
MANVRIQPSRALEVFISDNADIPYPAVAARGINDAVALNQLIDLGVDFPALQIYPGNIVYNINSGQSATILEVPIATPDRLILNADIFPVATVRYVIYQSSPMAGGQNTGCVLYVGEGGDISVTTAGNDIVTFYNVQDGTFMPVQMLKVWSTSPDGVATTASRITALW